MQQDASMVACIQIDDCEFLGRSRTDAWQVREGFEGNIIAHKWAWRYLLGQLIGHRERSNVVSLLQGRGSTIDYGSTTSEARGQCLGPK